MLTGRIATAFAGLFLSLALAGPAPEARAQEGPAAAGGLAVLDNDSYLRTFLVLKTPVFVAKDGQVQTALEPETGGRNQQPKPVEDFQSPLPPAGWVQPDFDDAFWERGRAPFEMAPEGATGRSHAKRFSAAINSLICLRSRFVVDDPARVRDLKLSLEYVGGVVVYVNGQEVARAHLPAGNLEHDTLAEKYPEDLYVQPGNAFLQDVRKDPAGFEKRYRKLVEVAVPAKLLRKGTNVLALEIHRAPINEAAIDAQRVPVGGMYVVPGIWGYAGLKSLALTAAPGSAIVPNVARPKGVQVWSGAPLETIDAFAFGDVGEPAPVTVVSPRNGVFSGRLVVSSDGPIQHLKATVGDLKASGNASIPASAIRVRYAEPAQREKSWAPPHRFDGLRDEIPAEIAVIQAQPPRENFLAAAGWDGEPVQRKNQPGALAPLWFTVRVPKDAQPGQYEATVTVAADGFGPKTIPLRLTVTDWTMPDPKDFRVHNFAYLSEDAVALHYGVPRWSDEHFALMGESMKLMAEVNSRQAVLNLTVNFYGGNKGGADSSNAESMVRWIRQPDGSFQHDFTLVDKYLDLVARSMGKPTLLRVNCFGELKDGQNASNGEVTALDPATGRLESIAQPPFGTEESYQFWKPVLDELRRKIEARGWWDVTAFGFNSYCYLPAPETVTVAKRLWPDGQWSYTAHNGTLNMQFPATEKGVVMPTLHADAVWTVGPPRHRGYAALFLPRTNYWCDTWRSQFREYSPLVTLRMILEDEIMAGHDGVSDFGADLFPVKSDDGRYFYCVGNGRGTGGPGSSTRTMLAPGPKGAIGTERFEMLREGAQLAEAILFLHKSLAEKKLDAPLAARIEKCLDDRGEAHIRQWPSSRFERDLELLTLTGEAARAK